MLGQVLISITRTFTDFKERVLKYSTIKTWRNEVLSTALLGITFHGPSTHRLSTTASQVLKQAEILSKDMSDVMFHYSSAHWHYKFTHLF